MILTRKYETTQIHLFLLLFWHWPGTFFYKTNSEREWTTRKVIGLDNAIKDRFNYVTKATVTLELKAIFKHAKTELAFSALGASSVKLHKSRDKWKSTLLLLGWWRVELFFWRIHHYWGQQTVKSQSYTANTVVLRKRFLLRVCSIICLLLQSLENEKVESSCSCRRYHGNSEWWDLVWAEYDESRFTKTFRCVTKDHSTTNILKSIWHDIEKDVTEFSISPACTLAICCTD